MTSHDESDQEPLLDWVSRDGPDPSVRFVISEKGVSRSSGKGWRATREAGRALGWVALLGSLVTGRSGSSAYGPTSHWLASKPEDKQFMSWKHVRKVDVDDKRGTISLYDGEGTEIRLCCTPATFESSLRMVKEHATDTRQ
jgi:hypothetical protein